MRLSKAIVFFLVIFHGCSYNLWGSREAIRPSGLIGARSLAMGGSGAALPGHANHSIINPASLVFIDWPELSMSYGQRDVGDQQIWSFYATYPFISRLVGQFGVLSLSNPHQPQNELSSYNLSLAFPLSPNGQLIAGLNGKLVSLDLTTATGRPSGGGVDLGMIYTILENQSGQTLRLGIAMLDAQTIVKLDDQSFTLPTVFRYGLSMLFPGEWSAAVAYDRQSPTDLFPTVSLLRAGLEKNIVIQDDLNATARMGYFHELNDRGTITLGLGMTYRDWRLAYALQCPTDFYNSSHQLELTWALGQLKPWAIKLTASKPRKRQQTKEESLPETYSSIFSALDSAAENDNSFLEINMDDEDNEIDQAPEVSDDEEAGDSAYSLPVPEGPAASEEVGLGITPEMPATFASAFSGAGSQFQIVKEDIRLHAVINPFSPNRDGKQDKTIFVGRLVNDRLRVNRWTLYIIRNGEIIRRFQGGRRLPRQLEWDGKDQRGKRLRDGKYQAILRALDENNLEIASAMEMVEIRTRPKAISITGPSSVRLGGQNKNNVLTFKIPSVFGSSDWQFTIINPDGKRVYRKNGSSTLPQEINWNPNRGGTIPMQGSYRAVLRYRDSVGLRSRAQTTFSIAHASFKIKMTAEPTLFKPGQAGAGIVSFKPDVSGQAKVNKWQLRIINEADKQVVRTYAQSGTPPRSIFWDGLTNQKTAVKGGDTFIGRITVTTALGTKAIAESNGIQCDIGAYTGEKALSMNLVRIVFKAGSSTLTSKGQEALNQAAQTVTAYKMDYQLQITGYADKLEKTDDLLTLSRKRAKVVTDFLVKQAGIPVAKVQQVGRGAEQPIVQSGSAEDRRKNRRVEVVLFAK